jgi:hypothetical protein
MDALGVSVGLINRGALGMRLESAAGRYCPLSAQSAAFFAEKGQLPAQNGHS